MNKDKLREEIAEDEGCKFEIYLDHLGLPTCGIGHLVVENDPEYGQPVGTPVDEERVRQMFNLDIAIAKLHSHDSIVLPCSIFLLRKCVSCLRLNISAANRQTCLVVS